MDTRKFDIRGPLNADDCKVIAALEFPETINPYLELDGNEAPEDIGTQEAKIRKLQEHDPRARKVINWMYISKLSRDVQGKPKSTQERLEAAYEMTHALMTDAYVDSILERITARLGNRHDKNCTVYIPQRVAKNLMGNGEIDKSVNILEAVYVLELTAALNKKIEAGWRSKDGKVPKIRFTTGEEKQRFIIGTTKPGNRTVFGVFERIFGQKKYDFGRFKRGDLVWIADDHVQSGGTSLTRLNGLRDRGAEVLGMSSLTALPESKDLCILPEVQSALRKAAQISAKLSGITEEKGVKALKDTLALTGMKFETLTNREALSLMALLLEPGRRVTLSSGDTVLTDDLFRTACAAAGYKENLDLSSDALTFTFRRPLMTLATMQEKLDELISRIVVKGRAR